MPTHFPILDTNRLLLRQITESDLPNVFLGLSLPDMVRYYGVSYNTLEETKVQMEWYRKLWAEQTGV